MHGLTNIADMKLVLDFEGEDSQCQEPWRMSIHMFQVPAYKRAAVGSKVNAYITLRMDRGT